MKKIIAPMLGIGALLVIANWGSSESSTESKQKHAVNFSGVLTPVELKPNEKPYAVDNIAINNRYDQIPLYKKPINTAKKASDAKRSSDENYDDEPVENGRGKNMLLADPSEGIVAKVDLAEVDEIIVPEPERIWSYQKRRGSHKAKYVEIVVVSNDDAKTRNSYLIDIRRKVTCNQFNEAGPIQLEAPFTAIKSLVIKGCKYRDADKKCGKKGEDQTEEEPAPKKKKAK